MRQGFEPALVYDNKGNIFAIATGSDACAEHEVGTKPLRTLLCSAYASSVQGERKRLIDKLRQAKQAGLLNPVPGAMGIEVPQELPSKLINQNLDCIQFLEGEDAQTKQPAAVLWVSTRKTPANLNDRELAISQFRSQREFAGAWDSDGFAFKVVGAKLVNKLKVFAQQLQAGHGVFAGTFLQSEKRHFGGVIVALYPALRPEHRAAIAKAQQRYEADLLLEVSSRLEELRSLVQQAKKRLPGYVWPVWLNGKVGSDVRYAVNPDYSVDAAYFGPYTFEQLLEWSLADRKFPLKPPASDSRTPSDATTA